MFFTHLFFSIGTHYFRGINNLQQPWNSWTGRKKHELKPNNPTEEGLASIHSVLFRKDPFLWRAALLYYTVYQASQMSFCELFKDIGKFVKDPNTRWDYCVRAKRGWTDTSQPGGCLLTVGLPYGWLSVDFYYILIHQSEKSLTSEQLNHCYLRSVLVFPNHILLPFFSDLVLKNFKPTANGNDRNNTYIIHPLDPPINILPVLLFLALILKTALLRSNSHDLQFAHKKV